MFRLFLMLLVVRNCVGDIDYPKCCESDSAFQKVNSTFSCSKNATRRIQILSNNTNFLKEGPGSGYCIEVEETVSLFKVDGTQVTKEKELEVAFYPKCCPVGYFYNTTTHGCDKSQNVMETFFTEKFVKIGLPLCKIIVDVNINDSIHRYKESKSLKEGLFCVDRDKASTTLIVRICHDDYSVCDKIRCVHKCCPDGQSFVNGAKCRDTFVHGLDLSSLSDHVKNVDDSFAIVHGHRSKVYKLHSDDPSYHLYQNGTFFHSEYDERLEIRFVPKYYEVEDEAYCIEHAFKNTMNNFYFFREFPLNDRPLRYLCSRIAMVISCVFLIPTMLYYCFSNEKRTAFGKALISFCLAVFITFSILSYVGLVSQRPGKNNCKIFTFLILYSTLASVTWMNVMCIDIYWAFGSSKSFVSREHRQELKRFMWYSLYGWGAPLILTVIALIFYYVRILPPALQIYIEYKDNQRCFMYKGDGNYAQFLFSTIPLAIIQLCNLILFIRTAVYCLRVKREINKMNDTHVTKGEKKQKFKNFRDRFGLLLKLFLIMGISFLFEVVSTFYSFRTNRTASIIEIVWDTFNSLQGLFIFVIFIVKKRNFQKIRKKVGLSRLRRVSLGSSAATQTTSVQSYKP